MISDPRIAKHLFREDGHYLGRPADFTDILIQRRVQLVEKIPGFVGSERALLDIGCGNGASMFMLSDKMKHCQGIEVTEAHLKDFETYLDAHNITNCDYKIVDVTKEQASIQYDRIISFEVIEHLSSEDGVKYYFDSLKPGGMMAISVPNKWWPFETHGAKLPLLPWSRVPFFSWLPRPIHERYANARIYTKDRIQKLLEKHGFEVVDYCYVTTPLDVLNDSWIKRFLLKYTFKTVTTKLPIKAPAIFMVARKSR
jgi:2-polyprenyl-3-methyl-5-hydroxy-6-metoxy-1,4-benzoquinol methylase